MDAHQPLAGTLSYAGACLSMVCGGTTSLFATYGSSFGEVLGFTQYETNLVASLGDYAHYMSAPLFGYLASRTGPTRVLQAAALLMLCGYLGLGHAFQRFGDVQPRSHHHVAAMSVLFALVGVGSKAAYMSSMAATARNFKHSRHAGVALGVPLSLYGLSTFVFSSVKARWFEADRSPARYLAFMAAVSGAAHLLASCFVRFADAPHAVAVAAAAATAAAARRRAGSAAKDPGVARADPEPGPEPLSAESIELSETRRRRLTAPPLPGAEQQPLPGDGPAASPPLSPAQAMSNMPAQPMSNMPAQPMSNMPAQPMSSGMPTTLPREAPVFQRFWRDPMAWALLLGLICFSGPGLAFVNNCGTMVRAMSHGTALSEEQIGQYKDKIVATQSFFSFSSRLGVGYLSDVWRARLRLPRAGLLVAAAALMIYAQTAAASVRRLEDLYRLAVLVGVAMGSAFTLAPTLTAETWGADNFGICWGIITLGPAVGGHVCNLIFGSSWDRGQDRIAARAGTPAAQAHCDRECFVPAFRTTTRIAGLGLVFFVALLCMPRATAMWRQRQRRWRQ
ncbi:hypothetical protein H4R18_005051 [Coemansia javaensis]|uniref:Probable transporter MCH1 n=1 Tax=Coemansia javaensis TaxID=2761396 RepID=A0A9W8H784_9FUNG|nr:hypothetical protein H4R18_005051 [Coemansia javaensis]